MLRLYVRTVIHPRQKLPVKNFVARHWLTFISHQQIPIVCFGCDNAGQPGAEGGSGAVGLSEGEYGGGEGERRGDSEAEGGTEENSGATSTTDETGKRIGDVQNKIAPIHPLRCCFKGFPSLRPNMAYQFY